MKKLVLIITFCLIGIITLQAQETEPKNTTTFGVKGGYLAGALGSVDDFRSGIYLGLFAETRFNTRWSLNYEILVAGRFKGKEIPDFEIPIHIKYHITNRWSVFAGPKLDVSSVKRFPLSTVDRNAIGVSFEIGAQYNINKHFFIEGRYSQGFTDQYGDFRFPNCSGGIPVEVGTLDPKTFRLGIGYRF